ncbi:MAG TPA: hypothetical protein VK302_11755, partial [Terriglobales bacterium]|nr:hypothetical protein [Terriglobales bacterium]
GNDANAAAARLDVTPIVPRKRGASATPVAPSVSNGYRIVGIYFMYDVKQFDPSEWSSPPLEGRIVDKEGLGRICVGRGRGARDSFQP